MATQSLIQNFASIKTRLTAEDAASYVQFIPSIGQALHKINAFLDRYESSDAMKSYYASYGIGESYYNNVLLLEGALIDAQ
jgi:hypothetical protein